MSLFPALWQQQIKRELLLSAREIRSIINTCLFFLMIIVFIPLTLPQSVTLLRAITPGLFWTACLLAFLLASERLFQQDHEDGVIEQWLVSGRSLSIYVSAKMLVHWLIIIIPMVIISPFVLLLFKLNFYEAEILLFSLILGTPALLSLCALAAAFGLGMQQKGIMMALILLPLTIPLMIFGSGAVSSAMQGLMVSPYLALLSAISILGFGLLPFAISAVIRLGQV